MVTGETSIDFVSSNLPETSNTSSSADKVKDGNNVNAYIDSLLGDPDIQKDLDLTTVTLKKNKVSLEQYLKKPFPIK